MLTTHIRDRDISDTPFKFDKNVVCPQPFQLSELYMDDCTDLSTFDYTTRSRWEMAITWGMGFLYITLVLFVRMSIAAYCKHRKAQILGSGLIKQCGNADGSSIIGSDGKVLLFWEVYNGSAENLRQVAIKCGPGKHIKIYFSDSVIRNINLCHQQQLTIQRPANDAVHVAIKIPCEYDINLRCNSALDRTTFIDRLQAFLSDIGVGHTIEEPQRIVEKTVYTKKDRQRLLENFFKSIFCKGAQGAMVDTSEACKDILECELTREEFADALSLKKDSLFVEQMFQLIDKSGCGLISVTKFLVIISLTFARGSLEDKVKLIFSTYDVDRRGVLECREIKKMLKVILELANTAVSDGMALDKQVTEMFESSSWKNKQLLTLEEFSVLLREKRLDQSLARLAVDNISDPDSEEKSGIDVTTTHFDSTIPHALSKVVEAYATNHDSHLKDKDSKHTASESAHEIPVQKRALIRTRIGRAFANFLRLLENYKLHIFYLALFELIVIGIFVERAYDYSIEREHTGLRRITGHYLVIARGAASVIMFIYSILLLTMSRNFIIYLRDTIFNYYIPLDSYVNFHKIVALHAVVFTFMHIIGHGVNFYHITTQRPDDLNCLFREVYHSTHVLPKFSHWLFLTITGFAGFLLFLVYTFILSFSIPYLRRRAFQAFWYTHHLYYIFYILLLFHGSGRLVQDPLFGNILLGPGIIYAIDFLISASRKKHTVAVVHADNLPSQVIRVSFKRPTGFDYKAGQWLRVASSTHNRSEFHSFTITSAPHEEYLSLHIRAVGPWTINFLEHCNKANLCRHAYPKLVIDGPFGEGHQDWSHYEVSILVGGGIGVTPFASILKELVHRFNIGARVQCRRVRQ